MNAKFSEEGIHIKSMKKIEAELDEQLAKHRYDCLNKRKLHYDHCRVDIIRGRGGTARGGRGRDRRVQVGRGNGRKVYKKNRPY